MNEMSHLPRWSWPLFEGERDVSFVNEAIRERTGVTNFFHSSEEMRDYPELFEKNGASPDGSADLGDFQTPAPFADEICARLASLGVNPTAVLEPTAGCGNFIFSALTHFPNVKWVYAIDIQERHEVAFKRRCLNFFANHSSTARIDFHRDNIFTHQFSPDFLDWVSQDKNSLLILGNPPWVTNAQLSRLKSTNVPAKSNLKNARGFDALTGAANFDIAESVLLRLLSLFSEGKGHVALLVKTSVIRNVIRDLPKFAFQLSQGQALIFDAKKAFQINANAALFFAVLGQGSDAACVAMPLDQETKTPLTRFGYVDGKFVSDVNAYGRVQLLEGTCPFTWRQGVKHDAVSVMLLNAAPDLAMVNGHGESVDVEDDLLFPFVKGSTLAKSPVIQDTPTRIIMTQTKLGENTSFIEEKYPRLWQYLEHHAPALGARRSAMYAGKPRFSIFGVGPYSFQLFKVGIASFYKEPRFSLVLPVNQKPVMLDDTSYFLGFDALLPAFFTWVVLNHPQVRDFFHAIAFSDVKRPYTKDILMRVNLAAILGQMNYSDFESFYSQNFRHNFELTFTRNDFLAFQKSLE